MFMCLENEVWKDVKGFEGKYQVSSQGRVKRLGVDKEFIVDGSVMLNGYMSVSLGKGKRGDSFTLSKHRLVLCTFTDKPFDYPMYVNHKDENKSNNMLTNLEWCTPKYNSNYGTQIDRGIETKLAKIDMGIYETKKITRENFTNLCKRREINPLDFTESWDEVSFSEKNRKTKLYNYFFVGEGQGTRLKVDQTGSKNPSAKPIEYWESNPTSMSNFKTVCKRQGWNYEDFEETLVGKKKKPSGSTLNLYTYKLKE